ncbi:MAG: AI-2E family transporter [Brumimicrobium sp.]
MGKELASIKKILIIIAIPIVFYTLHILSVIVVPLMFGLFFALLFMPLMRWFESKRLPTFLGLTSVVIIVSFIFLGSYKIVELASSELTTIDDDYIARMDVRLNQLAEPIINLMRINPEEGESNLSALLNNEKVVANVFSNVSSGINMASDFLTILLMSVFFMFLFLTGSVNIQNVLKTFVFKQEETSFTVYRQIEKDIFSFISMKIFISLITGVSVSVLCYSFGIKFPVFWGVAAFMLNFIQIIGPFVLVFGLSVFALIELSYSGTFLAFFLILLAIEAITGNVLEPIMMGKSFSINTITIIVTLSICGLIWGIPGFILSVPITVLVKKILESFPSTKDFSDIMS